MIYHFAEAGLDGLIGRLQFREMPAFVQKYNDNTVEVIGEFTTHDGTVFKRPGLKMVSHDLIMARDFPKGIAFPKPPQSGFQSTNYREVGNHTRQMVVLLYDGLLNICGHVHGYAVRAHKTAGATLVDSYLSNMEKFHLSAQDSDILCNEIDHHAIRSVLFFIPARKSKYACTVDAGIDAVGERFYLSRILYAPDLEVATIWPQ